MSRLVEHSATRALHGTGLAAFERVPIHAADTERYLRVEGRRAYETGNACETCTFWFTRLSGASGAASVDEVRAPLAAGLRSVNDPAVDRFAQVLTSGSYRVLLLDILPDSSIRPIPRPPPAAPTAWHGVIGPPPWRCRCWT